MEAIVAAPLIMIGIIYPDGHTFFGKADKLLHLLLLIYIRPVLIVIGFVMANVIASVSVVLLYETGVPLLNKQIGAWVSGYAMISSSEVNGSAANEMVTAVITILSLYMFIYMYYQVMLYSFSIIYRLPNAVNRWVGIPPSSSEQEDQARVEELAEGFKGMSSQLAQAGTEVAGSYGSITQTVNPMSAQKSTKSAMRKDASGQGAQMGKQLSSKGGDDD